MGANASGTAKQAWVVFDRRDWLAFDRADYLATKIVLGVTGLGSILFGAGGLVVGAATNAPLPVSYVTQGPLGIALPHGTSQNGTATIDLLLKDATVGERLGQALPGALLLTMTIAVVWLLFQLLSSIQVAEPFTRGNVRRINAIALIVGLGGLLAQFAQAVADNMIQTSDRVSSSGSLTFVFSFNPLPLVVMLVIGLVAEAFRRGVLLREDTEGLV